MKTSKIILAVITSALFCLLAGVVIGYPGLGVALFVADLSVGAILSLIGIKIEGGLILSACGAASAAILYDCTNPLVGGTESIIYVANRTDIASYTLSGLTITAITMVATKKFFKIEGATGANGSSARPSVKMSKQPYAKGWEHKVQCLAFPIDPTTKLQIEALNLADLVIIVQNKMRGATGNCAYELLGKDVGLTTDAVERDPNNKDTQGAWDMTFLTTPGAYEPHVPYAFFNTDYATTAAAIAALIA